MGALLAMDEAGGSVESLSAMREAVALAERNQPVGRTPLHLAASLGHVAVVRALLGGQADASLRDNDGLDAQALAARLGLHVNPRFPSLALPPSPPGITTWRVVCNAGA